MFIRTVGARGNGSAEAIGAYGVVLMFGEHKKELKKSFRGVTNNQMEMQAVIEALKVFKRKDMPVIIHSDSALVVNCINSKWYVNWRKKGWRKSDKKPVENKKLWEELLELYESFDDIDFVKVKGHSGDEYNVRADELANEAMDNHED